MNKRQEGAGGRTPIVLLRLSKMQFTNSAIFYLFYWGTGACLQVQTCINTTGVQKIGTDFENSEIFLFKKIYSPKLFKNC